MLIQMLVINEDKVVYGKCKLGFWNLGGAMLPLKPFRRMGFKAFVVVLWGFMQREVMDAY